MALTPRRQVLKLQGLAQVRAIRLAKDPSDTATQAALTETE